MAQAKFANAFGTAKPLKAISAAELALHAYPATPWMVERLLALGSITELDGKVKTAGKTTFVLAMLAKLLGGRPFLTGRTWKSPVVYLSEQSPHSFSAAIQRAGLSSERDLYVTFWHEVASLKWAYTVDRAVGLCRKVHSSVLIIDTLAQFAGLNGDAENQAGAALSATRPLQQAAGLGLAVLVVRHDRKAGGDVGDSARGSSAFTGAVDIVVNLARPEGNHRLTLRRLKVLSRLGDSEEPLMIDLGPQGYIVAGSGDDVALQEARRGILGSLPLDGSPMTEAQMVGAVQGSSTTVHRALERLLSNGEVERSGTGVRGKPYGYSRVAQHKTRDQSLGNQPAIDGLAEDVVNLESRTAWPQSLRPRVLKAS